MGERTIDVVRGVALGSDALGDAKSRCAEAHQTEEGGGTLAHSLECDVDLVEVDDALARAGR